MSQDIDIPVAPATERAVAGGRSVLRSLLRRPMFLCGALVLLFWLVCAVVGQWLVPHDPFGNDLMVKLQPPSGEHWFGTDALGRDVFSRVISGSRSVLVIPLAAASAATVVGTVLGLLMGYYGGIVDEALSRIAEAVMALPSIIIALLAITALGPADSTLIWIVAFAFSWVVARTVRAAVLTEAGTEYVAAARVRGENDLAIMFREILPNVLPVIVVEFTVRLGLAIFAIASLSFLGFGVQPPTADWGVQIADSYNLLVSGSWWPALFPCLAIASVVISIYLVAEAVGEAYE